ncbi:MAG: hypothetical protein GKS00_17855 [Alphaproteobacteria bacterium]|nr:hypothetical protein [Alphaproteobacteria bacterium]
MPLYLEPKDVIADLEDFRSVLIVPCPICPPMSLAMQTKTPFIDLFKHGLKTGAFEDYIQSIREPLEQRGIRTDVLTIRAPLPLMCLWTEGQRQRLVERAKDFEAVLVLGCNSATVTAKDALKDADCQVFQAMRMKAMANATTKFGFPPTMELERHPMKKTDRDGRHPADATPEQEEKPS